MPRLAQVMKEIKASQAKQGRQAKPHLPITPSILTRIKSFLNKQPEEFDNIMAWAAYTTCFFGFLCAGEISILFDSEYDSGADLSFSEITVDSPTNPTIISSKTNPFRKGVDIYLGCTHNSLCPITAMMAYLSVRRDTASTSRMENHQLEIVCEQTSGHLVQHWYLPRFILRPQFPSWCCYYCCPTWHPRCHYSTPW